VNILAEGFSVIGLGKNIKTTYSKTSATISGSFNECYFDWKTQVGGAFRKHYSMLVCHKVRDMDVVRV